MKGGLLTILGYKLFSGIVALAVIFGVMVFLIGAGNTASFAKTSMSALGTGFGVTVGSIPTFVKSMQDGQKAVDGGGKTDTPSKAKAGNR